MIWRTSPEHRGGSAREQLPLAYQLLIGLLLAAAASAVAAALNSHIQNNNLAMVYLLCVVLAAVLYGAPAAASSAVFGMMAYDFFFIAPLFHLKPHDTEYYITLPVMLVVGVVLARLSADLRTQAELAEARAQRIAELYAMSRELAALADPAALCRAAMRHLDPALGGMSVILLPDVQGRLKEPAPLIGSALPVTPLEMSLAQWAFEHAKPCGHGTSHSSSAEAHYQPLLGSTGALGVLAVRYRDRAALASTDGWRQLEALAGQVALALERVQLGAAAEQAHLRIEREQLRNSLLASISHDLRTPLATIYGAASRLAEHPEPEPARRRELAGAMLDEAGHMTELVTKVLDMARFEAGGLEPKREWLLLDEVFASVLERVQARASGHQLFVELPRDVGLVQADPLLLERVLVNLVENALKYTPRGSEVHLSARRELRALRIEVRDNGPGLPPGLEEAVFEKFFRVNPESPTPGVGLGLALCRSIVSAHHGRIWAEACASGGTLFAFTLPQPESSPAAWPEPEEL